MDIKTLQYFIAVVESTSITKAAKALHISQPPLSQQLKQTEVYTIWDAQRYISPAARNFLHMLQSFKLA